MADIGRPRKEEFMQVESMLKAMLSKYSKLNKTELGMGELLDLLSSKWYREEVNIMFSILGRVDGGPCDIATSDKILRNLGKGISRLADSQKRLREYEMENGKSWRTSICYPLAPHCISETPHLESQQYKVLDKVKDLLLPGMRQIKRVFVTPRDDMVKSNVSMLYPLVARTEGGGQIERKPDFRGKHVLVFCIQAPVLYGTTGFQSLLNLCDELHEERGDDVEIVMVARMNVLADTEEDFNHLLSGLPTYCLAVPYEEWEHRERIWKLLNGNVVGFQCVVYDTKGLFLATFFVNELIFPYGAEAFPFDELTAEKVLEEQRQLKKDKSLENLLRPRPNESSQDVVVHELNGTRKKCISEVIKNKHVLLCLCTEGRTPIIPRLLEFYEQFKEKEEFEIVLLYLPLQSCIAPDTFKDKIDSLLQGQRGWWFLPFNHSVSMRFWHLTRSYYIGEEHCKEDEQDKLIIVGPNGKILDMYGGYVIRHFGIRDAYPFTREAVVQKKMEMVRRLRLESLLEGQQFFRGDDPRDTISANTLLNSNKKIIIYTGKPLDYSDNSVGYYVEGLLSNYKEMKDRNEEFEVVFTEFPESPPFGNLRGVTYDMEFGHMPWYIHCPLDGTHTSLAHKMKELFGVQSLVGFGKDGCICSVKLLAAQLYKLAFPGLCLEDTLKEDTGRLFHFDTFDEI